MTATDPDYGIHNSRVSSEQRLFLSIIERSIIDLFGAVALIPNKEEATYEKHTALRFLTAEYGAWAKRREEICAIVGFDAATLRNRVIATLEGDDTAIEIFGDSQSFKQLTEARQLWANEKASAAKSQATRVARANVIKQRRDKRQAQANAAAIASKAQADREAMIEVERQLTTNERLLHILVDGPQSVRSFLFETAGDFSDAAIRKHLRELETRGFVERVGALWYHTGATEIAA